MMMYTVYYNRAEGHSFDALEAAMLEGDPVAVASFETLEEARAYLSAHLCRCWSERTFYNAQILVAEGYYVESEPDEDGSWLLEFSEWDYTSKKPAGL